MALVYENVEKVLNKVIDQVDDMKGYAAFQQNKVTEAINAAMAAAQAQFPDLVLPGAAVNVSGTLPDLPAAPAMPDIDDLPDTFTVPDFAPAVGLVGVDTSDAPVFAVQAPSISYPTLPTFTPVPMPERATVTTYAAPVAPDFILPEVPALRNLNLPAVPVTTLPTFSATAPVYDLETPETQFEWSETAYQERFVADVSAKLADMLAGNLGLAAEIETALWERARQRDATAADQAIAEAYSDFAARGFTLPPGALLKRIDGVRQAKQDNASQTSRDIAIESAKLRIDGVKFAIGQMVALEQLLWQMHEARTNRAFEAAKLAVSLGIQVFGALVTAFNARNQAFATQADVFRTQVEAELRALEIYKAELEGQKLIGELNVQDVDVYKARLSAVNVEADIYRSEVTAFSALHDAEKNKIDAYRAAVEAAKTETEAQTVQLQLVSEAIKAETSKVNVFEAQARAYSAEVSGYTSIKQLALGNLSAQNDSLRTQYAAYQTQIQHQASLAQQALSRVEAMTRRYTAFTQQYVAEADVAKTANTVELDRARLELDAFKAEIELQVRQADYTLKRLSEMAGLQVKGAEMVGQVSAQIAAQAVGAIRSSLSASGDAKVSAHDQYNYNP